VLLDGGEEDPPVAAAGADVVVAVRIDRRPGRHASTVVGARRPRIGCGSIVTLSARRLARGPVPNRPVRNDTLRHAAPAPKRIEAAAKSGGAAGDPVARHVGGRRAADELQREPDLVAQQLEHVLRTTLAADDEAP